MALKKEIPTDFGVYAEYHRITSTTVDWMHDVTFINVSVYISQSARDAGKDPVNTTTHMFDKSTLNITPDDNVVAMSYELLKTLPEYTDAQDC